AVMSTELLEEALANAWMYEKRATDRAGVGDEVVAGLTDFLEWWIPTLPGAYARGIEIAKSGIDQNLFLLTGQLDEAATAPRRPNSQWEVVTHLHNPLHN